MLALFLVVALVGGNTAFVLPGERSARAVTIVNRAGWGARSPTSTTAMSTPVPYVVIHHSESSACTTNAACVSAVKGFQNYHMDSNGWADIGYNWLVGGDVRSYEGRSWNKVGAHAPGYNTNSVGICVIGSFTSALPPAAQLQQVKDLIAYGVSNGYISSTYKLIGHRQAVSTDCPGNRLYEEIKTWPRWSATGRMVDGEVVEGDVPNSA